MPRASVSAAAIGLPASDPRPIGDADEILKNERAFRAALEADLIRGIYAMVVEGNCMAPALPHGTKMLIDAEATPRAGDHVAIHLCEEAAVRYGAPSAIKSLVIDLRKGNVVGPDGRRGVIVRMLNPPKALFFPAADIVTVHRIIGPVPSDMQTVVVDNSYFEALALAAGERGEPGI
jgi:hypothetical protein